jgi:hemerythrin
MLTKINNQKDANYWDDTFFFFDIETIDNQHKKLFELFDLIIELNAKNDDSDSIAKIIDELNDYADYHFKTEEDLMEKAKTKDIEMHFQQHAFFKNQMKEFRRMYAYQNQSLTDLMIVFLRKWFLIHIYDVDYQYVKVVKQHLKSSFENKLE